MDYPRNGYLVGSAFRNFLGASILTTVAAQLAVSTDAAIVSHLIGPHAMAAVNMVMPLLTVFLSLNSLLGVGASLLAAKAIGAQDRDEASRIFSASFYSVWVVGIMVSVVCCFSADTIANVLCQEDSLRPLVLSYLRVTSLGVPVMVLSGMLNMMVQSDGRPRLVTMAVMTSAASNVVLDIVFIRFLDWGIAGSAWATVINYTITAVIVATHLHRPTCTYRIMRPVKALWVSLKNNLTQGLPLMIANVLLGVIVFLINTMVDSVLHADGVYIVAVCLQLLMVTFVVLNGVLDAMFAIGGALLGEGDVLGLKMLNRRVNIFVLGALAAFTLFILITPGTLATIFGANDPALRDSLCSALRIFSLILLPFSVTVLMRALFQVLGHLTLSTALVVGQLVSIVSLLWIFSIWAPNSLWWSFPLSAVLLLGVQFFVTWRLSKREIGASSITLIPPVPENVLDFSCTVSEIADFCAEMKENGFEQVAQTLQEIAKVNTGKIHIDIHVNADGAVSIKDNGVSRPTVKRTFGLNEVNLKVQR